MTASKNSEVWVVVRVDSLAEVGGVPADVIAAIENQRRAVRTVRASGNDFASAMRLVEQEIY